MKKFIIIAVILILIFSAATLYINKVLIPKKFKSMVVEAIAEQTGKQVSLKSLEFSVFRGLILKDLVVMDGQEVILSTRQATCRIFIWPIFKKQIIIPSIKLLAPHVFLKRRQDNSFNLQDIFAPKAPATKHSDFNLAIFKLVITNGNLVFQDDTLPDPLRKEIKNIQLNFALGLPVKFKFNFTGQLVAQSPVLINASGEYKIVSQELKVNLSLKDLSVAEFSAYYGGFKGSLSGLIDLAAKFDLKNRLLQVNLTSSGQNLIFTQDALAAKFNAALQSSIDYNLENKKLEFNGLCDIAQADISGIGFLNQVKNLHGKFVFNQRSLVADSVKADLLGLPFEINLGVKDFSTKIFHISTNFDLSILPQVAKDKFKISWLDSSTGQAALLIKIHPDDAGAWVVQGELRIADANLKLDKVNSPIEDASGNLTFSQNGLSWQETRFKYQGINYQSQGTLLDFSNPKVKLRVDTDDLSVSGDFNLSAQMIKLNQLQGKYLDTKFLVKGDIDRAQPDQPRVDLTGKIILELSNLNKILAKSFPQITKLSPSGKLDTDFILSGPVLDFKHCYLKASATANSFSLYGLTATAFALSFLQEDSVAKIPTAYLTFYDGIIQASAAMNLNTPDLIYQLALNASGVDLAKLKNDTVSKQKDIAGIFLGQIKVNGAGSNLDKLEAVGSFAVSHGRLGELNLLQGLGKLLLARDLGKIEFSECACDFLLKDKFISTDKLKLHSIIVNLDGPVRIGFDQSLAGALDVEILNEMVPLEGTFKDVTTAIVGRGGKFGVIKLGGTLAEPKYSFKTAVGNIIQGLTNMIFKK
jgi:hypothetical protein